MKKLLIFALVMTILLCLSGCGEKDIVASIVNNDGEVEQLSAKELANIREQNSILFDNKYWCASATVEGKVKEVTSEITINGTYYEWTVVVEGGSVDWFMGKHTTTQTTVTKEFLASLNVGDEVRMSGDIVSANVFNCDISNGQIAITKI